MLQFNHNRNGTTIENVDRSIREIFADKRHEYLMAPIVIRTYGGRSFAGHCAMQEEDAAYTRYMRAWRRAQGAAGQTSTHANGYLP